MLTRRKWVWFWRAKTLFCVSLRMRRNSVVKNVGVCYFRHLGYHLSLHIFCDVTECHHQNGVIPRSGFYAVFVLLWVSLASSLALVIGIDSCYKKINLRKKRLESKLRRKYVWNILNEPQHLAKIKAAKRLKILNKGVTNLRERKHKSTN